MLRSRVRIVVGATLAAIVSLSGCGGEEVKYQPRPAPSGDKANLPPVANVPKKPIKGQGGAYTVWGASYSLRSRVLKSTIAGKEVSITGWIGYSTLPKAPECAVHKGGKGDPEGCRPDTPAFWICDNKGDKQSECIKVMGWASNYAQIFDAIEKYYKDDEAEQIDTFWQKPLPKPLPGVGARVTVTGTYATTCTVTSTGVEADPVMGVLTYQKIEYHEPPPEPVSLPGMDEKYSKPKDEKK
jgi:hypothetical protein